MKIISVSQGFTADHSFTSYEFLAVDKPLNAEAIKAVRTLSRRCQPDARRVSFIYHADGYDIPGGWVPLMKSYYDVMYSESYDWWDGRPSLFRRVMKKKESWRSMSFPTLMNWVYGFIRKMSAWLW